MSVTSLRYAHTEGHCNLKYVPASKTVVTCGADGEVRVFTDGIKGHDSKSHLIGDEVYAMTCNSQKVFVAPSASNTVRAYTLGKNVLKLKTVCMCYKTVLWGSKNYNYNILIMFNMRQISYIFPWSSFF